MRKKDEFIYTKATLTELIKNLTIVKSYFNKTEYNFTIKTNVKILFFTKMQ